MKSFLVNFSGHCFMTIKLERHKKEKRKTFLGGNCSAKVNQLDK